MFCRLWLLRTIVCTFILTFSFVTIVLDLLRLTVPNLEVKTKMSYGIIRIVSSDTQSSLRLVLAAVDKQLGHC